MAITPLFIDVLASLGASTSPGGLCFEWSWRVDPYQVHGYLLSTGQVPCFSLLGHQETWVLVASAFVIEDK